MVCLKVFLLSKQWLLPGLCVLPNFRGAHACRERALSSYHTPRWWKKSALTRWYGKCPINLQCFCLSQPGAGFLPPADISDIIDIFPWGQQIYTLDISWIETENNALEYVYVPINKKCVLFFARISDIPHKISQSLGEGIHVPFSTWSGRFLAHLRFGFLHSWPLGWGRWTGGLMENDA